jgi:hypothetical protein
MLPFDRPVPKRFEWDDPDNPEKTKEIRNNVAEIARLWRNREACWLGQPRPNPDEPIPRWLWKRCYRLRNRYHSLEDTLRYQQLFGVHRGTARALSCVIADRRKPETPRCIAVASSRNRAA